MKRAGNSRTGIRGPAAKSILQRDERLAGLLEEGLAVTLVRGAEGDACLTPRGASVGGKAFCDQT